MDKDKEEFQHDWYGILGCDVGSTSEELMKAARKLSLKYHPDKTTDPEAPAKFLLIQKAKEIFSDESRKKLIDDYHANTKKREDYERERNKGMDERRKRFRDALDRNVEQEESKRRRDPNDVLAQEIKKNSKIIESLRKQNQGAMEVAREEMHKKMHDKAASFAAYSKTLSEEYGTKSAQIKIKWKRNLSHNEDSLQRLLSQYGAIEEVTVSTNKGTSAVVTFSTAAAAQRALDALAASEDYRLSRVADGEEKESARASVFTHRYGNSALDESLHSEVLRAHERHQGEQSLRENAYSTLSSQYTNASKESGSAAALPERVTVEGFLAKEKAVLQLLRQASDQQRRT